MHELVPLLLNLSLMSKLKEPSVVSAGYSLMLGCRRGWLMDGGVARLVPGLITDIPI